MKFLKQFSFVAALSLGGSIIHGREAVKTSESTSVELIDTPTPDAVDHYGYYVSFRFGKDGNLQNKTIFGVFPRLNLGFGLDGERILGTGDARLNKPTINLKLRAFDGKGLLPAVALGYDGQGYHYNKTEDEYEQRQKGFYLVGGWHPFTPDLSWTLGMDVFDFDTGNSVRGFTGLTYTYQKLVGFMFEYDNFDDYKDRRLNFGAKVYITPVFTVDLVGRDVPKTFRSDERETERVIRLTYTGSF